MTISVTDDINIILPIRLSYSLLSYSTLKSIIDSIQGWCNKTLRLSGIFIYNSSAITFSTEQEQDLVYVIPL